MKMKVSWSDVLLLLVSLAHPILLLTVFSACGPKEDGGWMNCHWAWSISCALGILLALLALLSLLLPNRDLKRGLSLAMLPTAILTAIVPGTLIPLCMMEDMTCRAVTQPAIIVLSVLTAIAALVNLLCYSAKGRPSL